MTTIVVHCWSVLGFSWCLYHHSILTENRTFLSHSRKYTISLLSTLDFPKYHLAASYSGFTVHRDCCFQKHKNWIRSDHSLYSPDPCISVSFPRVHAIVYKWEHRVHRFAREYIDLEGICKPWSRGKNQIAQENIQSNKKRNLKGGQRVKTSKGNKRTAC